MVVCTSTHTYTYINTYCIYTHRDWQFFIAALLLENTGRNNFIYMLWCQGLFSLFYPRVPVCCRQQSSLHLCALRKEIELVAAAVFHLVLCSVYEWLLGDNSDNSSPETGPEVMNSERILPSVLPTISFILCLPLVLLHDLI